MTLNDIMFYLFAGSILTFSLLTVISRRILRSAVYLLFVLVSTAGIYFMLNYNFLAAVQLTVYAGGIIVLIIFSILLTSHVSEKSGSSACQAADFFGLAVAAGAVLTILTITKFAFTPTTSPAIEANVTNVGRALVSTTGTDLHFLSRSSLSCCLQPWWEPSYWQKKRNIWRFPAINPILILIIQLSHDR